jgi:hypothetical protein
MTILLAWLLADLISGLVHWYEDRAMTGQSRFAFLNSVRADNERHHKMPGFMLKFSWWGNINTTAPFAWLLAAVLFYWGVPLIVWLTPAFLSFGNLVHRWAHESPARLYWPIKLMQWTGLFITFNHHAGHHYVAGKPVSREDSRIRFCVMSNWLNPILDYVGLFRWLDKFVGPRK